MAVDMGSRNGNKIVAVGQVNEYVINIMAVDAGDIGFFEWCALIDEKEVYYPHNLYDTMEEALDAALEYCAPDAEKRAFTEPTEHDYEALNALLYVGGAMQPITSMHDVVGTYNAMMNAVQALEATKIKALQDVESIEDILASAHHGSTAAVQNLNSISGIFQSQCDVLILILTRSCETLGAFIENFVQ